MDVPQGLCPQDPLTPYPWSQPPGPRASFLQIMISFQKVLLVPGISRSRFLVAFTIPGLIPSCAARTWLEGPWPYHVGLNLHTDFISTIFPLHITSCARSCSSWFRETPCSIPVPLLLPQSWFYHLGLEFISQLVSSSFCFLPPADHVNYSW